MSQGKSHETIEMTGTSSSGLVTVKESTGISSTVGVKCYWLVLIGVLGAGLVGLCIGLYFVGVDAGVAMATPPVIIVSPPAVQTSTPRATSSSVATTAAVATTPVYTNEPGTTPSTDLNYRIKRNIVPVHYKVTIFADIYGTNSANFGFSGWEIVTIRVASATDRIILHSERLVIDFKTVELYETLPETEEPLPFDLFPNSTTGSNIKLRAGFYHETYTYIELVFNQVLTVNKEYKLRINWSAKLTRELYGLYLSSYTDDLGTHYLAATQFQATHARKAFPCFDEPDMKAIFQFRLVRDLTHTTLFNTANEGRGRVVINDRMMFIDMFSPTIVMSSYLVAFAVHDFYVVRQFDSAKGRLYRFWGRRDFLSKMDYIVNITQTMLDHLDTYYSTEYPFNKMDFIGIPDFAAGAMENWGLVTFTENSYYYDPVRDPFSQKERIASITAHELAHMDFGNLVTTKWWDDIWLNEGFASYNEYVLMPPVEPSWEFEQRFLIGDVLHSMKTDCLSSTRPITQSVASPGSVAAMFDTITYSKGASLCRMMRAFLTESIFQNGLRAYMNTYKYNNTVHDDLFSALTAQATSENKSIDVNAIMKPWTIQAGYPVLNAASGSSQTGILTVLLSQAPFELEKGSFGSRTWWIPINSIVSTNANTINPTTHWFSTTSGSIGIQDSSITSSFNGWYILNANHDGFYRVNYDNTNWQRLIQQLYNNHQVINALTRTQLIDDAHFLARGNYSTTGMTYSMAFNMTNYLCNELQYAPWQSTLDNINYVEQMFMNTRYDEPTKHYGRTISYTVYYALGWENIANEISTNHFLRTSILSRTCRWNSSDCTNKAVGYFAQWKADPVNFVPPTDTISTVRCYGIKFGSADDWSWLYALYTSTTLQSDRNNYINALGCSNDITRLEWFLTNSLGNPALPVQEFTTIYTAVANNPASKSMVTEFFYKNWYQLIFNAASSSAPRRIMESTFQYVNTQAELDRLEAWKKEAGDLQGSEGYYNAVVVTIRNNIAWMNAYSEEVGLWLSSFDAATMLPPTCSTVSL